MNKIKGSQNAVKMKYLLIVFATAVLVSLPTRVYQLLAIVDTANGFYKGSDITIAVLYAAAAVFIALFLGMSFVSKEVPSPKLPAGKNMVLGVASLVMSAGLVWDIIDVIRTTIPANTGNSVIFISLLKSNISENGGAFTVLRFVFAFLAICYFLVFAISHLNGKASYKEFKLLALTPLCWAMTQLIVRLMNAISFVRVSELLFEIFAVTFTMIFFLTFARISSGVFTEDSMWGIYGYGFSAAFFALLITIPRAVISAVGLENVKGYGFNFTFLATAIFMLAYIFASLGLGFKDGIKNRRAVSQMELSDIKLKKKTTAPVYTEKVTESVEEVVEEAPAEIAEPEKESVEEIGIIEEEPAEKAEETEVIEEEPAQETEETEIIEEEPAEKAKETEIIEEELAQEAEEIEIVESVIDEEEVLTPAPSLTPHGEIPLEDIPVKDVQNDIFVEAEAERPAPGEILPLEPVELQDIGDREIKLDFGISDFTTAVNNFGNDEIINEIPEEDVAGDFKAAESDMVIAPEKVEIEIPVNEDAVLQANDAPSYEIRVAQEAEEFKKTEIAEEFAEEEESPKAYIKEESVKKIGGLFKKNKKAEETNDNDFSSISLAELKARKEKQE